MSNYVDANGVMHEIPGIVIEAEAPDEQIVTDAIAARQQAEATEEHASPNRWLEADSYAELKQRGWEQKQIAERCQVSEATVSRFLRCVRDFPRETERPSFWQAYQETRTDKGKTSPSNNGSVPERPWTDEELALRERLEDGDTTVVSLRDNIHDNLIAWATDNGLYVRIDRRTEWGNPFETPADGDRETVIRNYADHYLPNKPSLINRLGDLQGKALGCWCAPEPCHGDVLKQEADG